MSEAKQSQAREQSTMRAEMDTEKQKLSELYQERCRDYAQMVCDEREDEVTKKVAGKRERYSYVYPVRMSQHFLSKVLGVNSFVARTSVSMPSGRSVKLIIVGQPITQCHIWSAMITVRCNCALYCRISRGEEYRLQVAHPAK